MHGKQPAATPEAVQAHQSVFDMGGPGSDVGRAGFGLQIELHALVLAVTIAAAILIRWCCLPLHASQPHSTQYRYGWPFRTVRKGMKNTESTWSMRFSTMVLLPQFGQSMSMVLVDTSGLTVATNTNILAVVQRVHAS
jgi:hypothetical protein